MIHFLLQEIVTIFAVSATVVILFHFLKQPPIAGFIMTGVLVGPSGFGWIKDPATVGVLAEVGLIFLLFTIGIEFSLNTLSSMRRAFFGVGALQIFFTSTSICFLLLIFDVALPKAVLFGLLVSLSSTAISLNLLHRRRELLAPHGSLSVAVLLFQDLFAIPLLLVLPLFSPTITSDASLFVNLMGGLARASILLVSVFLGSRYVVPLILRFVTGTGVRELFLITIALLAFGSAWLGSQVGLSVVFGAFLAGILVSETHYGHQVVADLVPLREPFVAIFFVSVGMLLDLKHFVAHWPLVLGLAAAVVIIKFLVGTASAYILRYDLRTASLGGLHLAQIGEFSFVVAQGAFVIGALDTFDYQTFLGISVVSMLVNPTIASFAPLAWPHLIRRPFYKGGRPVGTQRQTRTNHVIIIGLGVIGQSLAKILAKNQIAFVGIETDSGVFHRLDNKHVSVMFGDGARKEILEAADIIEASLVVIAINDTNWTANVVASVRQLRPDIRIIVRCQHFKDMEKLEKLNVDEFVVAEAQMAVEFSERVLKHFGVEQEIIMATIEETERANYRAIRKS